MRKRRDRGEALEGPADATFLKAWDSYLLLLRKKARSEGTIKDYTDKVVRCLTPLHHKALASITRADASKVHADITEAGHPYMANGVMRVGHAVYAHAAKDLEWALPGLNPFRGRNLHNKETPRESALNGAAAGLV